MSTMDGLAARFRRRAGKGSASKRSTQVAPGDGDGDAHAREEASGVGKILKPRARNHSEAEAVARAVLEALSSHDPL